ncbi:MAG: DUF983 domain-containing protein [Candidatus Rokuibacteriota bacterium]|nr:MAG: DUF983 domain-containing protein [Candidatus Rokubacteria bacterium]
MVDRLVPALRRAVRLRCPRCGGAPLFRAWTSMAEACALCGLRFERAQGYFVGAIYINYAVTVLVAIVGFLFVWGVAGFSTRGQLTVLVPLVAVFPLWFFRYSRSFWLAVEWAINPES